MKVFEILDDYLKLVEQDKSVIYNAFVAGWALNSDTQRALFIITPDFYSLKQYINMLRPVFQPFVKKTLLLWARCVKISKRRCLKTAHPEADANSFFVLAQTLDNSLQIFQKKHFDLTEDVVKMNYKFLTFNELQNFKPDDWKIILEYAIRRGKVSLLAKLFPMFSSSVKEILLKNASRNIKEDFLFFESKGLPQGLIQKRLKEQFVAFVEELIKKQVLPPTERYADYVSSLKQYAQDISQQITALMGCLKPEQYSLSLTEYSCVLAFNPAAQIYVPEKLQEDARFLSAKKSGDIESAIPVLRSIKTKLLQAYFGVQNIEKLKKMLCYYANDLLKINLESSVIYAIKCIYFFQQNNFREAEYFMRLFYHHIRDYALEEYVLGLQKLNLYNKIEAIRAYISFSQNQEAAFLLCRNSFKRAPEDPLVLKIYVSLKKRFMKKLNKTYDGSNLLASLYSQNQSSRVFLQ